MEPTKSTISDRIKEARRLSDGGKVAEGLAILDTLAAEFPENEAVANHRALLFANHMTPEEALNEASALKQKFPASYYAAILQAGANNKLGRGAIALEHLDEALRLGAPEKDTKAKCVRGLALVERLDEARRCLDDALRMDPDSKTLQYERGHLEFSETAREAQRLAGAGHVSEAIAILDSLGVQQPENEAVARERALLYRRHLPPSEALFGAKDLSRKFPNSYFGALLQAYAFVDLRRGKAALEQLDIASRLGSPESETVALRARALILAGKKDEANRLISGGSTIELLRAKFELNLPADIEALDRALAELESAGASREELATLRSNWFSTKKQWQDAADALEDVLAQNPDSPILNTRMARIELQLGKIDQSQARLESVLSRTPENIEARKTLAHLALRRGRILFALKQFRVATRLALNPRSKLGD